MESLDGERGIEMANEQDKYAGRLKKGEWIIRTVAISIARRLVQHHHYAHGASNTATYLHGLFRHLDFWDEQCQGIAWWIPPTKSAALATYPENWQGVLCLSRLVIKPRVPQNACSFLLAGSMKQIDRGRWPCLVTYADEWQGHDGTIYRASNWRELPMTKAEPTFVKDGRMIARKAGGHTRTRAEMEALGAKMIGRFAKHKFVHIQMKQSGTE